MIANMHEKNKVRLTGRLCEQTNAPYGKGIIINKAKLASERTRGSDQLDPRRISGATASVPTSDFRIIRFTMNY